MKSTIIYETSHGVIAVRQNIGGADMTITSAVALEKRADYKLWYKSDNDIDLKQAQIPIDDGIPCIIDGVEQLYLYNGAKDTTKDILWVDPQKEHRCVVVNSFPLYMMAIAKSCYDSGVKVQPCELQEVKTRIVKYGYVSLWGHKNTVADVSALLGVDMTPTGSMLIKPEEHDNNSLCFYEGKRVDEVFVVAPVYNRRGGGIELSASEITSFEILRIVRNYPG